MFMRAYFCCYHCFGGGVDEAEDEAGLARWREAQRPHHTSSLKHPRLRRSSASEAFGGASLASITQTAKLELNKAITSGVSTIPPAAWRSRFARLSDVGALATVTIATFLAHHNSNTTALQDESLVPVPFADPSNSANRYYSATSPGLPRMQSRSTSLVWMSGIGEMAGSLQGSSRVVRSMRSAFGHNIIVIDLRSLRVSDSDFAKLVPSLMEDLNVRRVYLGDNLLTDAGLDALIEQFKDGECNSRMEVLSLPHNPTTMHGFINLVTHLPQLPSVTSLDISASPSPSEMSPLLQRRVEELGYAISKSTCFSDIILRSTGAGAGKGTADITVDPILSPVRCPVQEAVICQILHRCTALRTFGCLGIALPQVPPDALQNSLPQIPAGNSPGAEETRPITPNSGGNWSWTPTPMRLSIPQRRSERNDEPVPPQSEENCISLSTSTLTVAAGAATSDRNTGFTPRKDRRRPARESEEIDRISTNRSSPPTSSHPIVLLYQVMVSPSRCLRTLILRTPLSLDAVELIARGLEASQCLTKLILRHCELTATAFRLIGVALQRNKTLRHLDLSYPHQSLADPGGVSWERHTAYEFSHGTLGDSDGAEGGALESSGTVEPASGGRSPEPAGEGRSLRSHREYYQRYCASSLAVICVRPHRPLHAIILALSHPSATVEELVLMGVGMDVNDVEGLCETIEVHSNRSLIHVSFSFTSSEALLLKLSTLIMRNRLRLQRYENADDYVTSTCPS